MAKVYKRSCEVHIDNFKVKTKTLLPGTEFEANLLGERLKLVVVIYPAGRTFGSKGYVSVQLRNDSPYEAVLNYSFAVGSHVCKRYEVSFKGANKVGDRWGIDKFMSHEDEELSDKFVLTVTVGVWRAGAAESVDQAQVDTALLASQLEALDSKISALTVNIQTSSPARLLPCPECPICLDDMKPPTKIIQCRGGHLICGKCQTRPSVKFCPSCREEFTGRAVGMEGYLRQLFGLS